MGLGYRFGNYRRHVYFGKRTVKEGEACVVWSFNGTARQVLGPSLERLCFSTVAFLDRHVALPHQYLRVFHRSGCIEHVRGPVAMFQSPVRHTKIEVCDAITLTTHSESIVVFRETASADVAHAVPDLEEQRAAAAPPPPRTTKKALELDVVVGGAAVPPGGVRRLIVQGPAVFVPAVRDVVQSFEWSEDPSKHVLKTCPTRLALRNSVRTRDGAEFEVSHDLRVALRDVPACLDAASDPLLELKAAFAADLAAFGAGIHSDELRESAQIAVARLGDLSTFAQLVATARSVGFEVLGSQVTAFAASKALQKQMDRDAAAESARRSEHAQVEQGARLEELRLSNAALRASEERAQDEARQSFALQLAAGKRAAELEWSAQQQEAMLAFLQGLKERAGVDVTRLLAAHEQKAAVPDEQLPPVFRLLRAGGSDASPFAGPILHRAPPLPPPIH